MGVPISNVTRRVVYEADGTGPYSFSFEILANTDIAVYKDDALLTLTTDYTVTINANGTGSITLTASPTGADQIAIVGNRTIQRTTDFVTGGDFFANTVNDEMDQQTIFNQQNAEGLGRALQAPQTDPTTIDMTLPRASVRAGKVLAFDSNGDPTTGEVIGDYRGNWTSGTAYNKRDIVKDTSNGNIYYCNTAHTASGSQPLSTNTDSAKWTLIIDVEAATDAADAAEAAQAAAETAETNAETAETNAETAATAAASSASAASTSASAASTSATNAASSASTASTAATNAGNSATAAASSASSASSSASSASTSATNAASSASSASTSASNASTSATNAASSASSASTSASNASTSATNASNSATAAATSATNASNSATAAATSATNAANSATAAAASAAEAATFDPDLFLAKSGNLSGLASASTARTNLGVAIGTDVQAYSAELQGIAQGGNIGMKNRIINGAMMIDQRNAGAAITTAVYSVDRWSAVNNTTGGAFSLQQSSVVPSTAFTNSIKWTTTTAASALGSTESAYISQWIEGYNCSDFGLGAAGAATVTLSFWARSSLTGTFSVSFKNSAANRGYAATYTINAADTWEFKTVTLTMDTTGTWVGGNGAGLQVVFSLGAGSSRSASAGSWQAANVNGATGTTSVINTLNATFYITGVQLEKGSTATSFDYRPYGTELALCQRYFERLNGGATFAPMISTSYIYGGNSVYINIPWRVAKRATPSISLSTTVGSDLFSCYGTNTSAGSFPWTGSMAVDTTATGDVASVAYSLLTGSSAGGAGTCVLTSLKANQWLSISSEL